MRSELDDDTIPTGNTDVLAEVSAALADVTELGAVEWAAATSAGLRRRANEDAWGHDVGGFVVADGMGGHLGGATAATMAVTSFLQRLAYGDGNADWSAIVHAINGEVRRAGHRQGMPHLGTTMVAAVVAGPIVTIISLGDSRAYRLTRHPAGAARLDLLTHDHTVRAELLAAGLDVGAYQARGVALHGLTSFVGLEPDSLRIDVLAVPMRPGERILLCTDGVHRQLADDALRDALSLPRCEQAARRLVDAADAAGGRDNATALVIEIGTLPEAPSDRWGT
ncbi:MAG: PP2C family protein-serine/threonine phosphatase [Desertimonas sp.]